MYKRSIAVGLLLSLLPMLCTPFLGASRYNGAEKHVEWLRGQLKGEINETVDRAIHSAALSGTHNLQLFLEAFVEAYFEEKGAYEENLHIDKVLMEILQRHWRQLIVEGVVPYLSLKSLQARTTFARDRAPSAQFLLLKNEIKVRLFAYWSLQACATTPLLVSTLTSLSIIPRGP